MTVVEVIRRIFNLHSENAQKPHSDAGSAGSKDQGESKTTAAMRD